MDVLWCPPTFRGRTEELSCQAFCISMPMILHIGFSAKAYDVSPTCPQSEPRYITKEIWEEWWAKVICRVVQKSTFLYNSIIPFMVVLFLFYKNKMDKCMALSPPHHLIWFDQLNKGIIWTYAHDPKDRYLLPSRVEDLPDDRRAGKERDAKNHISQTLSLGNKLQERNIKDLLWHRRHIGIYCVP